MGDRPEQRLRRQRKFVIYPSRKPYGNTHTARMPRLKLGRAMQQLEWKCERMLE